MDQQSNVLVLEILRQDNHLAMSLNSQEELGSTIKHYSQRSLPYSQVNKLCREVTEILNKADKKGALGQDSIDGLRKAGQLLWDQLLTRPAKERLKSSPTQALVLSIDEELVNIPWELLYDGRDFLCLKFDLGRLVRTRQQLKVPQYRSMSTSLRMLVLANPTNDLESAYLEGVYIRNQFDRQRKRIKIDFKSSCIDTLYVKKNLRDYDIVHFAGHCEYSHSDPQDIGWVLDDGRLTAQDILALAESSSLPSLVFANACHSARVFNDLVELDYQEKTYSLAAAFLFSGVRHYIGAIRKIEDPVSLNFAKEFYTHLIKGKSVGECVRASRLKLIEKFGMASVSWANYLLYGDPGFTLLKAKAKPPVPKIKASLLAYKKPALRLLSITLALAVCAYLYTWLPAKNPSIYFLLHKSRAAFLDGKNSEAISICASMIKKEPQFLASYPLLADTYERLGKRDEALKYYFEYAFYSQKAEDNKSLAAAYISIGWAYHNLAEYPKAFDFYNKAITLSRENRDILHEAVALRKLSVWYMDKEEYDKAIELLVKSAEINRAHKHIYEHRYNLACDYFDLALVFSNKDDFTAAKEFYEKSHALFKGLKLKNELGDYYFNLGEIFLFEKEYQKALEYYLRGLKMDESQGNLPAIASDYNMIGELYLEMGNIEKAEDFFNKSVSLCSQVNAKPELAAAYWNLGLLYKQKGRRSKARDYFRGAQEIYRLIDTPDYQNLKNELLGLSDTVSQ